MLTINSSQLDVFERALVREQYTTWSRRLSALFPHVEEGELLTRIENAVVRAQSLGIAELRDLTAYLDLCGKLGFDFDSRPEWARVAAWLRDARVSSPSRRLQLARESYERAARIRAQNQSKRDAFERR